MTFFRFLWTVAALAFLAASIAVGILYGWLATAVLVIFAIVPDGALVGAFSATHKGQLKPSHVWLYNFLHRPWIPLILLVGCGCFLLIFPTALVALLVVSAALGWMLHICTDRAVGYGLRAKDGSIIPVR